MKRLCVLGIGWGLLATGCGPDNVAPCRAYVDAYNEAYEDCGLPNSLDEQETCPETLNDGRDCVDYYQTLADSYACDDGSVVHDPAPSCGDSGA